MRRPAWPLADLARRSRLAHWGVHILVFGLAGALYATALHPLPDHFLLTIRDLVIFQILIYPPTYLLNDFADAEDDRKKQPGRSLPLRPPSRWLIGLLFCAGVAWGTAAFRGIMRLVPLVWTGVAFAYSVPPTRLKVRGLAGVIAPALTQRLLPFLVLCASHRYRIVPAALVAGYLALTGFLFIFHHQWEDLEVDRATGVRTWGVVVGPRGLASCIRLADIGLLACVGLGWLCALLAPVASDVPLRFAVGSTLLTALTLLLFRVRYGVSPAAIALI